MANTRIDVVSVTTYGDATTQVFEAIDREIRYLAADVVEMAEPKVANPFTQRWLDDVITMSGVIADHLTDIADVVGSTTDLVGRTVVGYEPIVRIVVPPPVELWMPRYGAPDPGIDVQEMLDDLDLDLALLRARVEQRTSTIRRLLRTQLRRLRSTDWTGELKEDAVARVARSTHGAMMVTNATERSLIRLARQPEIGWLPSAEVALGIDLPDVVVEGLGDSVRLTTPERQSPRPSPPPNRTVHPRLDAPAAVAPNDTFDVVFGISPSPDPALDGPGSFDLPNGAVDLEMTLVANGFEVITGKVEQILQVTGNDYPTATVKLRAIDDPAWRSERRLAVTYRVGGDWRGAAERIVTVKAPDDPGTEPDPTPAAPAISEPPTAPNAPSGGIPLDGPPLTRNATVTVVITAIPKVERGWFTVQVFAPSLRVAVTDAGEFDLGVDPQDLVTTTLADLRIGRDGERTDTFYGFAAQIGEKLPEVVWTTIEAALIRDTVPTVMFFTDDHVLPWELAMVPSGGGWVDRPELLGANVNMGRSALTGPPQPPSSLTVQQAAVVTVDYTSTSFRLLSTDAEQKFIGSLVTTEPLVGLYSVVRRMLIEKRPPRQLLHFAVHGSARPGGNVGLVLLGRSKKEGRAVSYLTPQRVRGMRRLGAPAPFVFLNACEVGRGSTAFGLSSGLADAFVFIGASAVIAPLWEVKDLAAGRVSSAFYRQTLSAAGAAPADLLRRLRLEWLEQHPRLTDEADEAGEADPVAEPGEMAEPAGSLEDFTVLAYQFFGSPKFRMRGVR